MNPALLLMRKLHNLTVSEACWILRIYGHVHDEIHVQTSEDVFARQSTPFELLLTDKLDGYRPAKTDTLMFVGGPMGKRNYYVGTLVTLVVDRILLARQTRNIGFAWLLNFDEQATLPAKEQLGQLVPSALLQKRMFGDERDGHWEPPVTMNDREADDVPFDAPVSYMQIGGSTYPIYEDGNGSRVVQRAGRAIPIRAATDATASSDDGTVYLWSSSGRTGVSV